MGYAGGRLEDPTYYKMGDHSESIQIDFDPNQIRYQDLLQAAKQEGSFGGRAYSRQYRSVVFYHDAAQQEAAREAGIQEIEPLGHFTRAEDYHQKYYLQQSSTLCREFYAMYPHDLAFTDSTAVMRANAAVAGLVEESDLRRWLPEMGLSPSAGQALLQRSPQRPGCASPSR